MNATALSFQSFRATFELLSTEDQSFKAVIAKHHLSSEQGCGSETTVLISDLDPTRRVISDPDPARGSFWIRILVCEIFVKFLHLKVHGHEIFDFSFFS